MQYTHPILEIEQQQRRVQSARAWRDVVQINLQRDEDYFNLLQTREALRIKRNTQTLSVAEQTELDTVEAAFKVRSAIVLERDAQLVAKVREIAAQFNFTFPIAADPLWELLRAWWLNGRERDATSVSFLLDRAGAIRLVHSGPQFSLEPTADGNNSVVEDFETIHKKIRDLLKK